MSLGRVTVLLAGALLTVASPTAAQGPTGTTQVRVSAAGGASADGALVELTPVAGGGTARTARVEPGSGVVSLAAPVGAYGVRVTLAGFHGAEHTVDLAPGVVAVLDVSLAPASGASQSAVTERDRYPTAYQTTFGRTRLESLPSSHTVWSLVETSHPFLVTDRIDGGGLWTGEQAWIGGQGSPAGQTTFRLGDFDVTDPEATGTPLVPPDLGALEAVLVESAGADAASVGPGPSIALVPRRPGARWTGLAEIAGSPAGLQAEGIDIRSIARMTSWIDGSLWAGGPLAGQVGLFAFGRVTTGKRVEREQPLELEGSARSFMAHLVARPKPGDEIRVLTALGGATRPLQNRARFADRGFTEDTGGLAMHATWARDAGTARWWLGGAYQRGSRREDVPSGAAGGTMERLQDGAPLDLVASGDSTRQRWDLQAGVAPDTQHWLGATHIVEAGVTIGGASAANRPGVQPAFAELVHGSPARVWDVAYRGPESRWTATTIGAYVSDRIPLNDSVTLFAGLRLDGDWGSADGAADGIGWLDVSPRVALRWRPSPTGRAFAITTGCGWYGHRLPLGILAAGDPAGPSGVTYRWDDRDGNRAYTPSELTPVAAVGLCCAAGEPTRIAGDLRRPTTREFRIGAEDVVWGWRWSITGIDRREDDLVALANVGVTAADYTVSYVDDPGVDILGNAGYEPLPIYDRQPGSFLRDRYELTNAGGLPTRHQAFEVSLERGGAERWFFRFGGTAYRSEGVGASRNYRADENDQGRLGEAFATPNAATNARGRLFYDRAFMMKVLGAYTAPGPVRGSFVARYQDGQPFVRMVIAEGLNQGVEFIQAYPRGGQRFTYTLTLDARVEASLSLGGRRTLGVTLDAFNLLDMSLEVEEDVVTGPAFRTITAVQPPRVIRLGLRFGF